MSHLTETLQALQAKFAGLSVQEFRGETTVIVSVADLHALLAFLKSDLHYNVLSDLAAVDYSPAEPRFAVAYLVYALQQNTRLRVKTWLSSENPTLSSVTDIWLAADWPEREAYDMMGIMFTGHPDLRRILMPVDWVGHPHRKDYPLGYEEVQFSFNWREVDSHKIYAKD